MLIELIGLGITIGSAAAGYGAARRFVRDRLRFVDAAQRRAAPFIAGAAALAVALPITWILPLVGGGTAVLFGASVGVGVANGASDIRRGSGYQITSGG